MGKQGAREWWPPEWPDWPENPEARNVVRNLFDIGLFMVNADASLRKSRMENSVKQAQLHLSQMTGQEQLRAQELVEIWQKSALLQFRIRWQRNREGLETVRHLRPQWYTAAFKMEKAEEVAAQLGGATHEYFRRRVEQYYISQEEKDAHGNYHHYPDFSALRDQWYAHKPITRPLPWPWDIMLQRCKQYEPKNGIGTTQRTAINWQRVGAIAGIVSVIVMIIGIILGWGQFSV